jgi:hypothetical protein
VAFAWLFVAVRPRSVTFFFSKWNYSVGETLVLVSGQFIDYSSLVW